MKTRLDPRHQTRIIIIQELFQFSFQPSFKPNHKITAEIIKNIDLIDALITKCAPLWPISQMNKIDISILRLAVYELEVEKKNPPKAIIDEAIELAKEFGGEKSSKFINGVLGNLINKTPE